MLQDDLADYLTTAGVATVGTDLFKGGFTDSPDAQVTIIDTGGYPNLETFTPGPFTHVAERPTVTVYVRGAREDRQNVSINALSIRTALSGLRKRTINNVLYHYIECSPPALVEVDSNKRSVFSLNCLITRARSTA